MLTHSDNEKMIDVTTALLYVGRKRFNDGTDDPDLLYEFPQRRHLRLLAMLHEATRKAPTQAVPRSHK